MSLRFSLLGLISLVTFAAVACAALVQPGVGWLTAVVSLTAAAIIAHTLRAMLQAGAARAAAVGWLLFAVTYLAVAIGPWLGETIGPGLATSKALNYAEMNWRKEDPNAAAAQMQGRINWNVPTYVDGTSSTLFLTNLAGQITSPSPPQVTMPVNCFQLSGHWLTAWIAGWLGAAIAVHFQRHSSSHAPCEGKGSRHAERDEYTAAVLQ